jgi:hypothetical protein
VLSTKRARSRAGKARGGRPAPRPQVPPRAPGRTAPWKGEGTLMRQLCLDCLAGEHDQCHDFGCKCTRTGAHPGRPGRRPAPRDPDPQGNNPPF